MTHYKVGIIDQKAESRVTEIRDELSESRQMIEALGQAPWFIALRTIQRRFQQSVYNQDGDKWVFIPIGTHDDRAIKKLTILFPDVIEKVMATEEEIQKIYAE
jgi:hypothetical protein